MVDKMVTTSTSVTLVAFFVFSSLLFSVQQPIVRIGIVVDGPWERNDEIRQMFEQEILTLAKGEFDVRFPKDKLVVADWSLAGVKAAVDRLLADSEVDLILTLGVYASDDVCRRGDLPKPVIAPVVIDAEIQGLPSKDGTSGVKNLNYLTFPSHIRRDIEAFLEIVSFSKVIILGNKRTHEAIPELPMRTRKALEELGVEPQFLPIDKSIDEAFAALPADAEAVYVAPLLHLPPGDFERLVEGLIERKLPSFSLFGISEVEQGLLATMTPDIFPRLTRRVALNVQRILLGEDAGTMPVTFAVGERLTINMATARKIGVSPPWRVITEADLLNEQRKEIERKLSLARVMQEAITTNLDLAAEERAVAAGEQSISQARSVLLPQINLSSFGALIDQDRAEASFGTQAQRTWTGSATFSQIIFSEPAWANVSIQRSLQHIRIQEREQLRLDIAQEAAAAYLNVLRAKTFERVQKENLKRTRSNLELAKVREAIGYSRRSEVFRWESEIANDRKDVIEANAQRNLAEIALNRLLHRPVEESFLIQEIGLTDPALVTSQQRVLDYFDDPVSFKTFRAFMVEEGIASSPELRALDAAIAAKEREFRSASRSFWLPTIALQAEIASLFDEGGAGTSSLQLPPNIPVTFPEVDDTNWNVGLSLSIPLFEGGSRFAETSQASEELEQLRIDRGALAERIEQRIRSALHIAGASYAGIALSQDAAEAARKNLDLVTDSYSRGAVDILDLLDAQNAALLADLAAANAVYDFLIDLMEVERSIGKFYFFASEEERKAWFKRADEYFEKAQGVAR